MDLPEGALGFGPGLLCTLEGLSKFDILIRNLALQGLTFAYGIPELLLNFLYP